MKRFTFRLIPFVALIIMLSCNETDIITENGITQEQFFLKVENYIALNKGLSVKERGKGVLNLYKFYYPNAVVATDKQISESGLLDYGTKYSPAGARTNGCVTEIVFHSGCTTGYWECDGWGAITTCCAGECRDTFWEK